MRWLGFFFSHGWFVLLLLLCGRISEGGLRVAAGIMGLRECSIVTFRGARCGRLLRGEVFCRHSWTMSLLPPERRF